jgi:SAM-dependent methyltransferase
MNSARFFRSVQDAPWYRQFLAPVLDGVRPLPAQATVLDLGMGPGKLLELGQAQTSLRWAGADSDPAMLAEARQRASLHGVALHQIHPDQPLPFAAATFDAVTCCSVLFLLPEPATLLTEITRILRPSGRLVVLTPSGTVRPRSKLIGTIGWDPRNWTFWLWRQMTAERGRTWTRRGLLSDFAAQQRAVYKRADVFHGLATLEVVQFMGP